MSAYHPKSFPAVCSCGAEYPSESTWQALPLQGIQSGINKADGMRYFDDMEMRNCGCRSTIVVKLKKSDKGNVD